MEQHQPLAGKVALITGAARGIGAGIAMELGLAGAAVCITDLHLGADAGALTAALTERGARTLALQADAGKRADIERAVATCEQELGPVSILVTNAIVSKRDSLLETQFDDLVRTVEVGIYGPFHAMQIVAKRMVHLGIKGSMIHISSPHARAPFKNAIDYNIAKAGSHHLALSAANELMWHGIRVNVVEPGWTDTPGERRFYSDELMQAYGERMPLGRMGAPADLGQAAVFLASDAAAYITGAVLKVDGGQFIEGGPSWEAKARHE